MVVIWTMPFSRTMQVLSHGWQSPAARLSARFSPRRSNLHDILSLKKMVICSCGCALLVESSLARPFKTTMCPRKPWTSSGSPSRPRSRWISFQRILMHMERCLLSPCFGRYVCESFARMCSSTEQSSQVRCLRLQFEPRLSAFRPANLVAGLGWAQEQWCSQEANEEPRKSCHVHLGYCNEFQKL